MVALQGSNIFLCSGGHTIFVPPQSSEFRLLTSRPTHRTYAWLTPAFPNLKKEGGRGRDCFYIDCFSLFFNFDLMRLPQVKAQTT
jgi:hypothetical protein